MADEPDAVRDNNGFDPEQLAALVARIENLQADIDEVMLRASEDCGPYRQKIAEVKREAADAGIGKKEFAAVIRKRRLEAKAAAIGEDFDLADRANLDDMMASLDRLAEQVGPLGEAARDRARAEA